MAHCKPSPDTPQSPTTTEQHRPWKYCPIDDRTEWSDADEEAYELQRSIVTDRLYQYLRETARLDGFILLDMHEGFDALCKAAVDKDTAALFDQHHDYGPEDIYGWIVFQIREDVGSALYELEDEGKIEWVIRNGWPWIFVPEATRGNRLDRVGELQSMPYTEYLRTPEWQERRRTHLNHAGNRCQACNGEGVLHVHHRTYANRGNERFTDLIVLCKSCHYLFHSSGKVVR